MATPREIAFDNAVAPGAEYTKSARFKEDLFNGGTPGEAKAQAGFFDRLAGALLLKGVQWFGYDGKAQPAGSRQFTSLAAFLGYADYNQAKLEAKIDAVIVGLSQLKPDLQQLMKDEFERSLGEGLGTYEVKLIPKEDGK